METATRCRGDDTVSVMLYGHYGRPAYWQRGPKYWLLH
jgi:hypothetical protein